MINYGIELEFFVTDKEGSIVPAYKATTNLDGNPVIGEIRTGVYSSIVDCAFEMDTLLFLEREKIASKGYVLALQHTVKANEEFLKAIRSDAAYVNRKQLQVLQEYSIYGKKLGKILPRGVYKASLQINISDNLTFSYPTYERVEVENHVRYNRASEDKSYGSIFDFLSIIRKLDAHFKKEITDAHRVPGVYAIKEGRLGKRIEYRSLPNSIYSHSIISALK